MNDWKIRKRNKVTREGRHRTGEEGTPGWREMGDEGKEYPRTERRNVLRPKLGR